MTTPQQYPNQTTADFRFIATDRAGNYRDVVARGIPVDDLAHAARKARATCLKHHCQFNAVAGYMPYAFVTLGGQTHRVDIGQSGEIIAIVAVQ